MYQCERIIAKARGANEGWGEVDKDATALKTLLNDYSKVWVVLSHTLTLRWMSLDLSTAGSFLGGIDETTTVQQWLATLGDLALPTVEGVPTVNKKLVKYNDATLAGYKAYRHNLSLPLDAEVTDAAKTDVRLYRDKTDYALLHSSCLFSFNGLFHIADRNADGVYLKDAGKSLNISGENHIGLVSFREIGALTSVPISPEMIYTPVPNGRLKDMAYIDVGVDIGDKIVLLVIGGYLHMLDSLYQKVGTRSIKIDMANLPMFKRYLQSRTLIDMTPLEKLWSRANQPLNPTYVPLQELEKDETIRTYLSLSQSFVVLVDTDNLYVKKHKVERSGLVGRYRTRQKPSFPFQTEMGRMPEYIALPDTGPQWTLCIQDNYQTTYRHETADWLLQEAVDGSAITVDGRYFSQGHLIEIGSDVVTFAEP